jgi:hypothetical protein
MLGIASLLMVITRPLVESGYKRYGTSTIPTGVSAPPLPYRLLSVSERMTVGEIQRIGFCGLYINELGFKFNTCVDHTDPETTARHR